MEVKIKLKKEDIFKNLTEMDLDMHMSFGFVVRSRLGSLIALRAELDNIFADNFHYPELSGTPLFVVHWNDITKEKQNKLESKNKRR